MPVTLTIKNVPEDTLALLKSRAQRNHRSLQGELMCILEQALGQPKLTVAEADARLRALGFRSEGSSEQLVRELRDAS